MPTSSCPESRSTHRLSCRTGGHRRRVHGTAAAWGQSGGPGRRPVPTFWSRPSPESGAATRTGWPDELAGSRSPGRHGHGRDHGSLAQRLGSPVELGVCRGEDGHGSAVFQRHDGAQEPRAGGLGAVVVCCEIVHGGLTWAQPGPLAVLHGPMLRPDRRVVKFGEPPC